MMHLINIPKHPHSFTLGISVHDGKVAQAVFPVLLSDMGSSFPTASYLHETDDASAKLILQLQLTDLQDLTGTRPGKQREGTTNDGEVAASLLEQSLESVQAQLADRRMTKSIAEAVQADGAILTRNVLEEETAGDDHALAHRLNGSNVTTDVGRESQPIDDTVLSILAGRFVSEDLGEHFALNLPDASIGGNSEDEEAEASAWAASRGKQPSNRRLNKSCVACHDVKKYFDVIAASCQHEYCWGCLRHLFSAALTDESLFPPRCCRQAIPLDSVGVFLTKELKDQFGAKKIEFSTPNRTYCCRPACSAFVGGDAIENDVATCSVCYTQTCTTCKSQAHIGTECPNDTALQAVIDLGNENNWQRCYSCRRMVELEIGCNHMTYDNPLTSDFIANLYRCRCGAQFCYICGQQWKTCPCDQWQEDRLVARANQVVQREEPRLAADHPIRIELVEGAVIQLRERHNCTHRNWRYVRGEHQCEECFHRLPQYIFECRQCRIQACNRCRRTRL